MQLLWRVTSHCVHIQHFRMAPSYICMTFDMQEVAFDYLSPFMPNIAGTRGLTRDEALVVREACLKALKERLIERANIIQVRQTKHIVMATLILVLVALYLRSESLGVRQRDSVYPVDLRMLVCNKE